MAYGSKVPRPEVGVGAKPAVRMMQPNLIVPAGADQFRLPAGYRDGNKDAETSPHTGNICPGC